MNKNSMKKPSATPPTFHQIKGALHWLSQAREAAGYNFYESRGHVNEAMFTYLIIRLGDVLKFVSTHERRVCFTQDVDLMQKHSRDVTDAVLDMRNAICHMPSGHHDLFGEATRVTFLIAGPKDEMKINFNPDPFGPKPTESFSFENPYQDDVAFFYGRLRLYLKRNILQAIGEALNALKALEAEEEMRRTSQ
ncbi:MAG: hypothetical protein ACOH2H_15080 [Cypionkella sp.]